MPIKTSHIMYWSKYYIYKLIGSKKNLKLNRKVNFSFRIETYRYRIQYCNMARLLRKEIFVVEYYKHQITGSKLPSQGDCLRVLFYNMLVTKLSWNESATLAAEECLIFLKKARIPTQKFDRCKRKLNKLYDTWKKLIKD